MTLWKVKSSSIEKLDMILKRSFQRLQEKLLNQIQIIFEEINIWIFFLIFDLGLPHFCHFDVVFAENYKVYYIEDNDDSSQVWDVMCLVNLCES
jgi:hypothetical protein